MKPVLLEVVTPLFSGMEIGCFGCDLIMNSIGLKKKDRSACVNEYPDDWKESLARLSAWIGDLTRLYRHRIHIRIIDPQSPLGLWKQIRHRVSRFPAFIVDRKNTYSGWDHEALEALIDERIRHFVSAGT